MTSPLTAGEPGPLLQSRYLFEGELGRGGMGVVYAARERDTGRRVAIKMAHGVHAPGLERAGEHAQQQTRLLMEARTLAAVRHHHIVEVLDVGRDGDALFLVMERLEGSTLAQMLEQRGRLAPAEAVTLLVPIMHALAALHRAGVVHRDVKPSNIFLSQSGAGNTPKLLDFGLARGADDARVTDSGEVMGTLAYMSPEHAAGDTVGPAADVWSLGIVLYECVAGRTPFPPLDRAALAMHILLGRVQPLLSARPDLPVPFAQAVDGALKRDLHARYRAMDDMADALVQALGSEVSADRRDPAAPPMAKAEDPRGAPTAPELVLRPQAAHTREAHAHEASVLPVPKRLRPSSGRVLGAVLIALLAGGAYVLFSGVPAPRAGAVTPAAAPARAEPPSSPRLHPLFVQELRPTVDGTQPLPTTAPREPAKTARKRAASRGTTDAPGTRRAHSGVEGEWW